MNIGIDARSLIKQKTGFGFYLMNILDELFNIDNKNTYYLFSDREIFYKVDKYKNVKKIIYKDGVLLKKSLWFFLKFSGYIKRMNIKLDVFWSPQHIMPVRLPKYIKKVLTVHDLTHKQYPKTTTIYNRVLCNLLMPYSIKKADKIVCISKSTYSSIKKYYNDCLNKQDIYIVYESGVKNNDINIKKNIDSKVKDILKDEYILFLGTIEPRKNIETLIKAYKIIKNRTKLKLIICGKKGWKCNEIINKIYEDKDVLYLNYINNTEKESLMKNCFCFVFPSIYEGFGIPVVEALQSNAVTLVADNSSLKEIIELDDLKFKTLDFKELAEKIIKLYKNSDEYEYLLNYCINRAKDFDWKVVSKKYFEILSDIC